MVKTFLRSRIYIKFCLSLFLIASLNIFSHAESRILLNLPNNTELTLVTERESGRIPPQHIIGLCSDRSEVDKSRIQKLASILFPKELHKVISLDDIDNDIDIDNVTLIYIGEPLDKKNKNFLECLSVFPEFQAFTKKSSESFIRDFAETNKSLLADIPTYGQCGGNTYARADERRWLAFFRRPNTFPCFRIYAFVFDVHKICLNTDCNTGGNVAKILEDTAFDIE